MFCRRFCHIGNLAFATLAIWNGEATARSSSAEGDASSDLPLNSKCIVTLDARSNSRCFISKGALIRSTAQWLVLKNMDSEYLVPRDRVLMVKVHR